MRVINWNQMSELGLIERINRELLHPLGLAVSRNPETGISDHVFVADDGVWTYASTIKPKSLSDDEIRVLSSDMATEVGKPKPGEEYVFIRPQYEFEDANGGISKFRTVAFAFTVLEKPKTVIVDDDQENEEPIPEHLASDDFIFILNHNSNKRRFLGIKGAMLIPMVRK
ncbi:DUF7415 domain-containing protein [Shewanella sp. SE1]|uniref:DUF7415 domain-containing protein n=1 Tax=Shewanella sp. SE1 TaxID=2705014 RepID=UPI00138F123F|nr:hypothetical protein [Shewanella sp. SE1]